MTKSQVCPYCKSANSPTTVRCKICGQRITKKQSDPSIKKRTAVLKRTKNGEITNSEADEVILLKNQPSHEHKATRLVSMRLDIKSDEKENETIDTDMMSSTTALLELEELQKNGKDESGSVVKTRPVTGSSSNGARKVETQSLSNKIRKSVQEMKTTGYSDSESTVKDEVSHETCQNEDLSRVKTYVDGFDNALHGGIPEGHVVLISGSPGTLKSSFSFYLLAHNSLSSDRKGLYITFEENSGNLLKQMSSIGISFDKIKDGLGILDLHKLGEKFDNSLKDWLTILQSEITQAMEYGGYKLLVIDSLGSLEVFTKIKDRRREIFKLFQWLKDAKLTSFVIVERPDIIIGGNVIQGRWDEDFLADGIIHFRLHHRNDTEVQRRIRCVKMRGTRHDTNYLSLVIENGAFKATKIIHV